MLGPVSEQPSRYPLEVRASSIVRRFVIIVGLLCADLLCFGIAASLLHLTSPPQAVFRGQFGADARTQLDLMVIIGLVFIATRYLVGDYSRRQLFWAGTRATTVGLMAFGSLYLGAVALFQPSGLLPAILVWTGMLFFLPVARQLVRLLLSKLGFWQLPTAILGISDTAQEVGPILGRQLALGLQVRWVVPENPELQIPKSLSGLVPILTKKENLVAALQAVGCRQVIIVPDDHTVLNESDIIDQLVGGDISVAVIPSLRRLPLYGLSASYFFGKDFLLLQVRNNLGRLPQRMFKRTTDLVGACLLGAILMPLFAILAFLIRREDRGPVFFLQTRVGRDGRDFGCWKFRTMVVDAEAQMERWEQEHPNLLARYTESNFKLKADPRVTRIGTWMRRNSLDELPQLLNVVLGEMSLVGPRPLLRRELPDYGAVISLYERVRPGITGLWQISGRSHTTFAERVSYDEWYIKNWTIWYDLVILLRTVWMLLCRNGDAY